jgi:hypothetical protein
MTNEYSLDVYVKHCIQKRLKCMHRTGLGLSPFYKDISLWNDFHKRKKDQFGQFFRSNRVKQLIEKHESLLVKWISFIKIRQFYTLFSSSFFFSSILLMAI